MTATGSCQTPLEGNALASGCAGCDGKAVYATITQYISGKKWYDNFQRITFAVAPIAIGESVNQDLVAYAVGGSMAAKKITETGLAWAITPGTTGLALTTAGKLTGTAAAGTANITVKFSDAGVDKLKGAKNVEIS